VLFCKLGIKGDLFSGFFAKNIPKIGTLEKSF